MTAKINVLLAATAALTLSQDVMSAARTYYNVGWDQSPAKLPTRTPSMPSKAEKKAKRKAAYKSKRRNRK
jgi:hypothetical protein